MEWHFRLGYLTASLLLFRLIWGFVGGRWSRFSSFHLSPRAMMDHLNGRKNVESTAGHNPFGALSILAMLLCLFAQVGTGLFAEDVGGEAFGPLSGLVSRAYVKLASGYHKEVGPTLLLLLATLHLVAVTYYYVRKKDNLVKPMFSGDKRLTAPVSPSRDDVWSRATASIILILCAALVIFVVKLGG